MDEFVLHTLIVYVTGIASVSNIEHFLNCSEAPTGNNRSKAYLVDMILISLNAKVGFFLV
jgi:hypothetical protein